MKKLTILVLVFTLQYIFAHGQSDSNHLSGIRDNVLENIQNLILKPISRYCNTGCFGLKCDFAIGESTGNQVDCYNIWTDYTLRLINNKPQWTSSRYGSNFYDNNAIDGKCYTCELAKGKFSPGAVQNWQGSDGSFSRYLCRVVNENGTIQAKWVFIAKCN